MKKNCFIKILGVAVFFVAIYGINLIFEEGLSVFSFLLTLISLFALAKLIKLDNNLRKTASYSSKNKYYNSDSLQENSNEYPPEETDMDEEDEDVELWLAFEADNSEEIHKRISSFQECRDRAYKTSNLDKRIELLRRTIVLYDEAKEWFYETKGGKMYFDTWYEHLSNSKNGDFSYIDEVKDTVQYYTWKKNCIIPSIVQTITDNKNILQKDIYQFMPEIDKSEIRQTIRELEQENVIKRTKKGNTYLLELITDS